MPTYKFLLHVTDFRIELEDGGPPITGFYTIRRARAGNSGDATRMVLASLEADAKVVDIFKSGQHAGLSPKIEVEETCIIPWWKAMFPWRKRGLIFYRGDADDHDAEGSI